MRLWILVCAIVFLSVTHAGEKTGSPGAQPLPDPPGLQNLYRLGTNLFSGSTPEGEAGFRSLAQLGVKTIITVDGAKPDLPLAKKFGFRYVHLPSGYDGLSANLQLTLAKASAELEGPLYIHCHHGQHRGPTAAAIICMSELNWTPHQAGQWLKTAGTSTNYAGLYETIRHFKKPSAQKLNSFPASFPETAQVSGLVDAMVAIDNTWENLNAVRAAGYKAPANHPDMNPANEATILWEHFREAQRLPDSAQRGRDFLALLHQAESQTKTTEQLLRNFASSPAPPLRAQLDTAYNSLANACSACHRQYRDH